MLTGKGRLFGTSGIRGILGRNLSPSLAYLMGIAFARYLGDEPEVLVGHDVRIHSNVLYHQVIQGLVEGGARVALAGILPTPALIHAQLELGYLGSVMATGSHAIPEVTGLLFFLKDGGETDPDAQSELEKLYAKAVTIKRGGGRITGNVNAIEIYSERIAKKVDNLDGAKLVFDSGNGCMGGIAGKILSELGGNVISINEKQDGNFPNRSPYPKKETLGQLKKTVIERRADFGVATDGDGDRAIFVAEDGRIIQGDVTGSLFADEELSYRRGKIVAPLNSSNLINYVCNAHKSTLITTKIGPPEIVHAIRKDKEVIFAFEETGKYIWPDQLLYGDAIFSTLKLVSLLRRRRSSLGKEVDLLPKYHIEKRAVRCKEEDKELIMRKTVQYCKELFPQSKFVLDDGVKVLFNDGSWLLIRPSGTEPFLRCYAESDKASKTKILLSEGLMVLKKAKD
ncbi:MAG: hypothetical protein QXV32_01360 [Conexivisphaerales archaeon]